MVPAGGASASAQATWHGFDERARPGVRARRRRRCCSSCSASGSTPLRHPAAASPSCSGCSPSSGSALRALLLVPGRRWTREEEGKPWTRDSQQPYEREVALDIVEARPAWSRRSSSSSPASCAAGTARRARRSRSASCSLNFSLAAAIIGCGREDLARPRSAAPRSAATSSASRVILVALVLLRHVSLDRAADARLRARRHAPRLARLGDEVRQPHARRAGLAPGPTSPGDQ